MLLDSASLYFRAFFGVPDDRTDPTAPPVNAVRGFLDFITTDGDLNEHGCVLAGLIVIALILANLGGASWPI